MRVFINENKHTENVSSWSWGLASSKGEPILNSVKIWDTKEEVNNAIEAAFKDWKLEVISNWNE